MKLPGLFDHQDRLESLSRVGDSLERLSQAVAWEEFRPILSKLRDKDRKSPAGRMPFDELLMFKLLMLQRRGLKTKKGSIVDATLVEVPIRRDSKEDNDAVKAGEVPPSISENPNVACQKDLDARWTKKHGKSYFGYKNHIRVDAESKLIREWEVTPGLQYEPIFEGVLCADMRGAPFWTA